MPRLAKLRRVAAQRLPIATKDQVRTIEEVTTTWREAYERLLAAVDNRAVRKPPKSVPRPDPAVRVRRRAEEAAGSSVLVDLRHGRSLTEVSVEAVREMLAKRRVADAQALAASCEAHQETRELGRLLTAIVASNESHHGLAVHAFGDLPSSTRIAHAPVQYFASLFATDPARGAAEVGGLASDPTLFPAATWFEILKRVFLTGDIELTSRVHANVVAQHDANPRAWKNGSTELAWIDRWIGAGRNRTAPPPAAGRVSFGLVDYIQPGRARASQNIGDQVQTLASLGHVVRHQDLRFHGDADVVDFVERMQARVRPELRLEGTAAEVELFTVDRDSSTYQEFPENTWLLEFGWHMHALFGLDVYDFPLHPNLNPIFVSFHCSKRALLSPQAIDYLKAHGPIGCRDWTTVDLLLSLDVPAFFSGCLTTTVDTVFPPLDHKPSPATVYVDVARSPVPPGHENVRQSYGEVKKRTFAENMQDAVDLLERYRTGYTDVVTTRLHCYLPTTSLGLKVAFEPKNNADVRFNGLFRLDTQHFDAIRVKMRDRLRPVLEAVFAGAPRDEVYALWRKLVAPEVAEARARHERPAPVDPAGARLAAAARALAPSAPAPAETAGAVDVVLTPTVAERARLTGVLASAAAHTSRPVRAWVVGRFGGAPPTLDVPGVELHWVDTTGLGSPGTVRAGERALDRAALSELVPVDRAVLLPVDAVVTSDLAELAALDLGGSLVAARTASAAGTSGFGVLYGATRQLDDAPDTAYEFYRRIHQRHVFDFDAYDTGVLVLDLDALRTRGAAGQMLATMRAYRIDDRAALHWYLGPDRAELDAAWAYVPTREWVAEPRLWHWADSTKPWSENYSTGKELWRSSADVR
ncbi:hypothetical protein GCM10023221_14400 [Luteimicrobium xylanilyticum]|uniref:Uncharacterized protein n=1 Tax=Luteimicrobium xylanilyticum TaxID=1133546 RepID=A0A5P9QCR3_9MICO|nr:glycosyltransferase [Luteimicrobium xylanilyticum]QFU99089.1 hypothetical protein KDY119_02615 [Luteimicrobium xylanilyticum]